MNKHTKLIMLVVVLLMIVGCATVPTGPSVMVLPAPGKPFDLFQKEDAMCRQWAGQQIGLSPQDTINKNTASGAVAGTAIGAGLGTAIGAASGNAGGGAAIGAASGLLIGTSAGSDQGRYFGEQAQRRYDIAYQQCMYAQGNSIPGIYRSRSQPRSMPPPPPADSHSAPAYTPEPYNAPRLPPPPDHTPPAP